MSRECGFVIVKHIAYMLFQSPGSPPSQFHEFKGHATISYVNNILFNHMIVLIPLITEV